MFDIQTSYSALRADLASFLDKASENNQIIQVTRQGRESAIILSESEYTSLVETVHLLRSPANARRLLEALEWSSTEKGEPQSLEAFRKEVAGESQTEERKTRPRSARL